MRPGIYVPEGLAKSGQGGLPPSPRTFYILDAVNATHIVFRGRCILASVILSSTDLCALNVFDDSQGLIPAEKQITGIVLGQPGQGHTVQLDFNRVCEDGISIQAAPALGQMQTTVLYYPI